MPCKTLNPVKSLAQLNEAKKAKQNLNYKINEEY